MIKKILLIIVKWLYFVKAAFSFWLYGSYGVCNVVRTSPFPFIQPLLLKYGAKIGNQCIIDTGLQIHRPDNKKPFKNLTLGDKVYLGHNILIDLTAKVQINDYTAFGANCQIWTHTGDWTYTKDDEKEEINSVIIGKACIIYSGVIISQGINIADYSRVGAGSVVLSDVKKMFFVAGIPAKEINKREI
jgi:acetyltransferase-like isoleucine patch superfamily enzyme